MRTIALSLVILLAGCFGSSKEHKPVINSISTGQTIREVVTIARNTGYQYKAYHSGADVGGVYAVCILLPDDQALLAIHDPQSNLINSLELVDNWSGSPSEQVMHKIDSYDLPVLWNKVR